MREFPAYEHHGWPEVVEFFERLAIENRYFVPMREFVNRLAASEYASGLHPMQSMHTLILSQHEHVHAYQDRVTVSFEAGEFVVRHQGGPTSAEWTKRGADGMASLERFFHHMRWFTEYTRAGDHPDAAV